MWVEIICKNDDKVKLRNFYKPLGMEAQYGLEASLFQEIRKVVEGNNLVFIMGILIIQTLTIRDSIQVQHQQAL